jgi:Arc/MetJ-type ribon-helix-helix transcriptional regulator
MFYVSVNPISMIPEYKSRIAFRLSTEERQKIDELIDEGKYRNISQVLRQALKEFLSKT